MKIRTHHVVMLMVLFVLAAGTACRLASRGEEAVVPTVAELLEPTAATLSTATAAPEVIETEAPMIVGEIRQWGAASDTGDYFDDGELALGPPIIRDCAYFPSDSAWIYQGERADPEAYLQVFYEQSVLPTQVNIHLAYYFSGIVSVSLIDLDGMPHEVYAGQPGPLDECPAVLSIDIDGLTRQVYAVRIDVMMVEPDAWEITAIDAVELVGRVAGSW